MYINKIQYRWRREAGADIQGPVWKYYNLFCFPEPVEVNVDGVKIRTRNNACIFTEPKHPRGFCFPQETRIHWLHAYRNIEDLLRVYEIPLNCVFYPDDPELVAELFHKIRYEFISTRPHRDRMLAAYTQALVIALSRGEHAEEAGMQSAGAANRKLRQLRDEMLSRPEEKWSVQEMAQRLCISPSRLHTVYKNAFGVSPMKDVIRGKIDYAKSLLVLDQQITLSVVAEKLGYTNQYHFIRQFKEVTGMTPGAYRNKNR